MTASDELLEARGDTHRELARASRPHALLEDGQPRALLLLAVVDEQLPQHADPRSEREISRTCDEETVERVAEERVLFERLLFGAVRSKRERVNELFFRERVTDDFVGERTEEAAPRSLFGLIQQFDDAAVLFF